MAKAAPVVLNGREICTVTYDYFSGTSIIAVSSENRAAFLTELILSDSPLGVQLISVLTKLKYDSNFSTNV